MRVNVRGAGRDGKPIAAQIDLPSTARVGDTFIIGLGGEEQEEVEILGMERDKGPDGAPITTVIVGPNPGYGWTKREPHEL
jgi:hypothetical protein